MKFLSSCSTASDLLNDFSCSLTGLLVVFDAVQVLPNQERNLWRSVHNLRFQEVVIRREINLLRLREATSLRFQFLSPNQGNCIFTFNACERERSGMKKWNVRVNSFGEQAKKFVKGKSVAQIALRVRSRFQHETGTQAALPKLSASATK